MAWRFAKAIMRMITALSYQMIPNWNFHLDFVSPVKYEYNNVGGLIKTFNDSIKKNCVFDSSVSISSQQVPSTKLAKNSSILVSSVCILCTYANYDIIHTYTLERMTSSSQHTKQQQIQPFQLRESMPTKSRSFVHSK